MVEVDETYIGGEEPGLRGGRAKGKKLLVGIAVELKQPRGLGRCRMAVLPDAKTDTLRAFLADHVEPGATVITDGWQRYRQATDGRYVHERQPGAGREANTTLPGVHRVASLAKRWLLGTHQGSVDDAHLPSYLDEFVFRFNRRRSRAPRPGLLPRPRARGRPPAGALPRPGAQPPGPHGPATATGHPRQATDAGPPAGAKALADR